MERDITRRYLVTVGPYPLPDEPQDAHLALIGWETRLEMWLHGQAICGRTVPQGEMGTGVAVTCTDCLARQSEYEAILAGRTVTPQEASGLYFCPAVGEVESSAHGGFGVCCDKPRLHIPLPAGPATDALSAALSQSAKDRYAAQKVADDAWGTVWLHGKWSYLTKCMTTPEREYAADCVARWSARLATEDNDPDRGEPEGLRWWRD